MARRTEIIFEKHVSLFEHRFISGETDADAQNFRNLREHRIFRTPGEHRLLGSALEHRNLSRELEELDPLVLDQATLRLSNPHTVSSVTVQRRSDGSFYLIIEE